jgi:hypothetical protein
MAALLACIGCSDASISSGSRGGAAADYPNHDTRESLVASADAVVIGEVLRTEVRDINVSLEVDRTRNPQMAPYLVSTVRVDRVIKGALSSGDVIEVKELFEGDGSAARLKTSGLRGALFLQSYAYDIPYSLVNPAESVLTIENGVSQPSPNDKLFKSQKEADLVSELQGLVE